MARLNRQTVQVVQLAIFLLAVALFSCQKDPNFLEPISPVLQDSIPVTESDSAHVLGAWSVTRLTVFFEETNNWTTSGIPTYQWRDTLNNAGTLVVSDTAALLAINLDVDGDCPSWVFCSSVRSLDWSLENLQLELAGQRDNGYTPWYSEYDGYAAADSMHLEGREIIFDRSTDTERKTVLKMDLSPL